MGGMQLLEEHDTLGEEVPVIFLTGFRDSNKMQKAWALCAYDFLEKPFDPKYIVQVAENALSFGKDYIRTARRRRVRTAVG